MGQLCATKYFEIGFSKSRRDVIFVAQSIGKKSQTVELSKQISSSKGAIYFLPRL
jgi:hypothetical protein